MALARITCPIDGLEFNLSSLSLDDFEAMLAGFAVGQQTEYWTDIAVVCPNGHHWAVNFKVEYTRQA